MVGAGDIIAHRLRRVASQEDRAGMAHLVCRIASGSAVAISRCSGAKASASGAASSSFFTTMMRAIVAPAFGGDLLARQHGDLAFGRRGHLVGKTGIVGDQDALRGSVMLGLAEQIGGDPFRIVGAIGDHQNFRRARDAIDADLAEDFALGRRDIGIAGTDDLVHRPRWFRCHRPAPPPPAPRRCGRCR